jgi:hypothetical protein
MRKTTRRQKNPPDQGAIYFKMSTKSQPPKTDKTKSGGMSVRTEFQLFQSDPKVVDYTERRLEWLLRVCKPGTRKEQLKNLLHAYKTGSVAVAWSSGEPVFLRVTNEDTGKPVCADSDL